MLIKNAMVTEVQSCKLSTTLEECAKLMSEYDCGAIPIVDQASTPVGIVTDRDITLYAASVRQPLWEIACDEVLANRDIHCCREDDNIASAVKSMETHQVRRLPVVDANGKLCGILSMGDIVSFSDPKARKTTAYQIPYDEAMELVKAISAHHQQPLSAHH
jgi:CBS-domain-containing membrane protein